MIREDPTRDPGVGSAVPAEPIDTLRAAITDAAGLTIALRSAIAAGAFERAAGLHDELAQALSRGEWFASALSIDAERASALRQVERMRGVASRLFAAAFAPNPAIEATPGDDPASQEREEQAQVTHLLARGSSPQLPTVSRAHRNTEPACPTALRKASSKARGASDTASHFPASPSQVPTADKEDTR